MKKNIFKILILIICVIGASEAIAQFSSAPAANTDAPINTSSADQVKTGDISVDAFSISKSAQFEKGVILQGILMGNSTGATTSALSIGGLDPANIQRTVDMLVANGKISVTNTVTLASLIAAQPANKELCATNTGTVVFCGDSTVSTATAYCGNAILEGTEECDDGNTNGTSASSCSLICEGVATSMPPRTQVNVRIYVVPQNILPLGGPILHDTYPCPGAGAAVSYIMKTAYVDTSVLSNPDFGHQYLYADQTTAYPALLGLSWTHSAGGSGGAYEYALVEVGVSSSGGLSGTGSSPISRTPIYGYTPYYGQQYGTGGPATYATSGQLSGDLGSCTD